MFDKLKEQYGWVKLTQGSRWQCGRTTVGFALDQCVVADSDPCRCQETATWERPGKCGCGSCDMTRRVCSECLIEILMGELLDSQRTVERAITLVRSYDLEIPSRRMAVAKISGFCISPPDEPDEFFRSNHPEKSSVG